MMQSMPLTKSPFSNFSMLIGNYVSTDFVPSTRSNQMVISESNRTSLAKTLEYNANGTMIATSHSDQQIRFWDTDNLQEKYTMQTP